MSDIGDLSMPRQWYLKDIDPDGKLPFAEVRAQVVKRTYQYYAIVVKRRSEGEYKLINALDLYDSFYLLTSQITWG